MKKFVLLALLIPAIASAEIWNSTSKDLPKLLSEGWEIVGFTVDNPEGSLEPTKFRYLLQLKSEAGNKAALCSETDRGSQHKCWIAS